MRDPFTALVIVIGLNVALGQIITAYKSETPCVSAVSTQPIGCTWPESVNGAPVCEREIPK